MATVGDIKVIASIDTSGYKRGAQEIKSTNNQIEGSTEKSGSRMTGALKSVGKVGFAALATTAAAAMAAVAASIPSAVRRVDTLNNSARTFQNMGFESQQSAKAVSALEKSIMGLPTPLDSAIRGMTALAATYGDVDTGQKVFTSLNNAILGFGGTAAEVDNAIQQLSQLPMDGPLDAQTWNSLRNSGLTPVLVAMAKESGTSVSAMKEAFGEGELTVQDFTDRLIKMNKDGGGGLKSLEKIAKDSTSGIGTGFANMQTAITRGMAKVIEAIGSKNIANAIASIGTVLETMLSAVATGIAALPGIVDGFIATIQTMAGFVKQNAVAFGLLGVAVGALAAPLAIAAVQAMILDLRIRAMLLWSAIGKIITGVATAFKVLNAAMLANPIGLVIAAIALLVAGFLLLWNNVEGFRNFFIDVWTDIQAKWSGAGEWLVNLFTSAWNGIKAVWNGVSGWFGGIYNGIVSFFSQLPGRIRSFFSSAWNSARSAWSSASGWFSGVVGGIVGVFAAIPGRISNFFSSALSQIKSIFSPSALINSGKALIDGLIGGITSAFDNAKSIVSGKLDDLRGLFPFSPAKEGPFSGRGYTTYSGRALMDDFAKGMASQSSTITSAARTAISGASSAFSGLENMNINAVGGSSAFDNLSGHGGGITNNINTVNIASEVDGERWLRRLNGNQEIVSNGLVPTQSYM